MRIIQELLYNKLKLRLAESIIYMIVKKWDELGSIAPVIEEDNEA